MKKVVLFTVLISFVLVASSQITTPEVNPKLLSKYSAEQLNQIKTDNPEELDYLNFYVDNSFVLMDFPVDKPIPYQQLYKKDIQTGEYIEITSVDQIEENFNPYLYKCDTYKDKPLFYRIGQTNKMIKMRPESELTLRYKAYKTMKNNQVNN